MAEVNSSSLKNQFKKTTPPTPRRTLVAGPQERQQHHHARLLTFTPAGGRAARLRHSGQPGSGVGCHRPLPPDDDRDRREDECRA